MASICGGRVDRHMDLPDTAAVSDAKEEEGQMKYRTDGEMQPMFRIVPPNESYSGLAKTEWQMFCCFDGSSMFAHLFFSGSLPETMALMEDMGTLLVCY